MIRIAICDDDSEFVSGVEILTGQIMMELKHSFEISAYTGSGMLAAELEDGRFYDLLLLDIEMPKQDGMSLAASIRTFLPDAVICFVTSHTEYAVKAYELSIFRYIPKAELKTCLPLALRDACRMLDRRTGDSYFIETARTVQKIPVDQIVYINKEHKYSVFVWGGTIENQMAEDPVSRGDEIQGPMRRNPVRKPLAQIEEELGRKEFLMIERGYLINLYHVEKLEGSQVFMSNGDVLPVSRGHLKEVREAIRRFWRERL